MKSPTTLTPRRALGALGALETLETWPDCDGHNDSTDCLNDSLIHAIAQSGATVMPRDRRRGSHGHRIAAATRLAPLDWNTF